MTVAPELRAELLRAAAAQAAAQPHAARAHTASPARHAAARRRATRLRRGGLPLVAALLVTGGGLATGAGFVVSQSTKDRSHALTEAAGPTAAHPGRVAKLGDPMVRQAAAIEATLPYPPGLRDDYDWSRYSAGATLGTGGETKREMQLMIETRAVCLWQIAYLRAADARDAQGQADAARIISEATRWPATRSLDGRGEGAAARASERIAAGDLTWLRRSTRINCGGMGGLPEVNPLRRR